jgi:hypothetical protein
LFTFVKEIDNIKFLLYKYSSESKIYTLQPISKDLNGTLPSHVPMYAKNTCSSGMVIENKRLMFVSSNAYMDSPVGANITCVG